MRRHAFALVVFTLLVVWWLWPMAREMSVSVPGAGPGDNLTFVWNVWWTRFALSDPARSVFFSPWLFHPFGADLTLHSNTLLPAVAVSPIANAVLAQNLLIAAHLFLNFVCAYAIAWRETRHWAGSLTAAVAFGWSPYLSAHLPGHFNLIAAWTLPLVALTATMACEHPTVWRGAIAGAVLGATAYVDYYYFVFAAVLVAVLSVADAVRISRTHDTRRFWDGPLPRIVLVLLAVDGSIVAWILTTGGGDFHIGGTRVSAQSIANPVTAAWLLILVWISTVLFRRFRPQLSASVLKERAALVASAGVTLLIVLAPLIVHAMALWRAGGYTTQRYFWRSAPSGIDLVSLVLGNPFSIVYGGPVRRAYDALGINLVENVGWLGPAVVVLAIVAVRKCAAPAMKWFLPAIVFGVWSLGPYFEIAGRGTTLWLPATLIRWVPVIANARIPARAFIVASLCCAVLSAYSIAWLRGQPHRRRAGVVLMGLLALDYAPRPTAIYRMPDASIYAHIRGDRIPGAVCELPLGTRDGFGESGKFDARVLYYQTVHERPILGGFVARLPPAVTERYQAMPIVGPLLRLSGGGPLSHEHLDADRQRAAAELTALGVRYVVVDQHTASQDLKTYVDRVLPLRLIARTEDRALYLVDPTVF
jgi:hypothetical protein